MGSENNFLDGGDFAGSLAADSFLDSGDGVTEKKQSGEEIEGPGDPPPLAGGNLEENI